MNETDAALLIREYTPGDIGIVADIKPALIRDWRRRNILGAPTGIKDYSAFDATLIFLLGKISAHGLPIKWTPARNLASEMLLHFALMDRHSWQTDAEWQRYTDGSKTILKLTVGGGAKNIKSAHEQGGDEDYINDLKMLEERPASGWRYLVLDGDRHRLAVDLSGYWPAADGGGITSVVDIATLGAAFARKHTGPIARYNSAEQS